MTSPADRREHGEPSGWSWLRRLVRSYAVSLRAGPVTLLWRRRRRRTGPAAASSRGETPARMASWGSAGAALGLLLWDYIETSIHERPLEFVLSLALGAIFVNFIEPEIRHRLSRVDDASAVDDPAPPVVRLRLGALLTGALVGLTFELIHSAIGHDPNQFFRTNVLLLVKAGLVTYGWARGAAAKPARATWYGLASGAAAGLVSGVLGEIAIAAVAPHAWRTLAPSLALAEASRRVVPVVVEWAGYGLVGGYLIDRLAFRRGPGPALAPTVAAVIGLGLHVVSDFSLASPPRPAWLALSLGRSLAFGLGWTFGLLLCPGARRRLSVPGGGTVRPSLGWVTVVVVAYAILSGNVLYRWFPTTATLFEEDFSPKGLADRWTGSCPIEVKDRTLIVNNPGGRCAVAVRPGPGAELTVPAAPCAHDDPPGSFVTPLVIGVDVSATFDDGQALGIAYQHDRGRSAYVVWITGDGIRLATGGPMPTLLASRHLAWPKRHGLPLRFDVGGRLLRVHVDGVPVLSALRPSGGCMAGDVTLTLDGVRKVVLHDVHIGQSRGSTRPF